MSHGGGENLKRAILVISFGTTYENARRVTIDKIQERIQERYKDYEVKIAFTSHMIIEVLKSRDGVIVDNPEEALQKLKMEGFEEVIVQPLHIIPGEEFEYIIKTVEKYKGNFKWIKTGRPILCYKGINGEIPDDYEIMVEAIKDIIHKDRITIFMGHGTSHYANACYSCLQLVFRDKGFDNVFVANVEGYPSLGNVISYIDKNCKFKDIMLIPLMVVAGDHAKNDMAGDDENSWKNILIREGFSTDIYLHGLGELEKFQNIYIEHLENALEDAYLGIGSTKKGGH